MFTIENYEVVLVPAETEDNDEGLTETEASQTSGKITSGNKESKNKESNDNFSDHEGLQGSSDSHPDALALLEHDIIITFDQNDWPAVIPAGVLVPDPCLDAKLKGDTLLLSCPVKGKIEEVAFINVPDEVCDLLRQSGRLTFAGLNENGVVWEQTISLFV